MTNAEAIRILCLERDDWETSHCTPMERKEAFNMAIKALEAQEWISVNKKSHPDTPERVQVQLDNGWIITAYYEENEWLSVPYCDEPIEDRWIEAWRPLPEPYKEDI